MTFATLSSNSSGLEEVASSHVSPLKNEDLAATCEAITSPSNDVIAHVQSDGDASINSLTSSPINSVGLEVVSSPHVSPFTNAVPNCPMFDIGWFSEEMDIIQNSGSIPAADENVIDEDLLTEVEADCVFNAEEYWSAEVRLIASPSASDNTSLVDVLPTENGIVANAMEVDETREVQSELEIEDGTGGKLINVHFNTFNNNNLLFNLYLDALPYLFTSGSRIGSKLLYSLKEKHLYRRQNPGVNGDRYKCTTKTCRASVKLTNNILTKSKHFVEHNHVTVEDVYKKNLFENQLKNDVKQCVGSIYQVYKAAVEK